MRTSRLVISAVLLGALAAAASAGEGRYLLDDAALDQVTAGAQSDPRELAEFDFQRTAGSGRTVHGSGSLALAETSRNYTLVLGDGAQQNLSSLVNINAIGAQITVLLNLTINVDSSVGALHQNNFNLRAQDLVPPGK